MWPCCAGSLVGSSSVFALPRALAASPPLPLPHRVPQRDLKQAVDARTAGGVEVNVVSHPMQRCGLHQRRLQACGWAGAGMGEAAICEAAHRWGQRGRAHTPPTRLAALACLSQPPAALPALPSLAGMQCGLAAACWASQRVSTTLVRRPLAACGLGLGWRCPAASAAPPLPLVQAGCPTVPPRPPPGSSVQR